MLKKYLKIRSSIYGQVVYVIAILSIFLFASYGIISRYVSVDLVQNVVRQYGNSVASIIEGSLYQSMLENDKTTLQNTLKIINSLPGISDVNMYNNKEDLVYTSFSNTMSTDSINLHRSNCKGCHLNIESMFHKTEKSYKVINTDSDCEMNQSDYTYKQLFIKSPILNKKSCSTSACHVHQKSEKVLGSLIIKIPLDEIDSTFNESTMKFFLLALVMTLLLIFFMLLFTRRKIKNPLNAIIKASKDVANGNTNIRLELKHNQLDDMRMVSYAFNNMLDNLSSTNNELKNWSQQLEYKIQKKSEELKQVHNELIHVERMASLGKLSSSVAHEINNPLSGVLTYTKLVHKQLRNHGLDDAKKEQLLDYLKMIESETKRCGEIVKGLLDFSRTDQKGYESRNLHEILRETYNLMIHTMRMASINFETELTASEDLIKCSPNQIKQICVAILGNSSEAIKDYGEIIITTKNPDEYNIILEITDNGSGISPEDIPHIFEPFFSKKDNASGIGLGLAVVHGIVQSHNGKVGVESKQGAGTTISITITIDKKLKDYERKNLNINSR